MGKMSWFGWLVFCSLNNSMGKPIGRILAHLGAIEDGQIQIVICSEKITIDQALINQ
jgi:hypothetical protein